MVVDREDNLNSYLVAIAIDLVTSPRMGLIGILWSKIVPFKVKSFWSETYTPLQKRSSAFCIG
jgi:hypothetical protein